MDSCDLVSNLPDKYRDVLESVLQTTWKRFAAASYKGYLQRGRGFLLLMMPDRENLMMDYVSLQEILCSPASQQPFPDKDFKQAVFEKLAKYDPCTQIVFLFDFPCDEAFDSLLFLVEEAAFHFFVQKFSAPIPAMQRYPYITPKEAYIQLLAETEIAN